MTCKDRIAAVPIDEDPLDGPREAVGDAFDGRSVEELKAAAQQEAARRAAARVRRD